jgi:hypothetical protein
MCIPQSSQTSRSQITQRTAEACLRYGKPPPYL